MPQYPIRQRLTALGQTLAYLASPARSSSGRPWRFTEGSTYTGTIHAETLDRLGAALGTLLHAGADAGVLRPGSGPFDVGLSLAGIALITSAPD
ncbi:hypothetical protein [Streptomyces sp. NPDC051576]|uniref:hypothetical protein n=1 Tax=Streptomyces sp. NPDC051576 TaxID=3155803 RepID=UPI003440B859